MKKLFTLLLCFVLVISTVGCARGSGYSDTVTVISITMPDGGLGTNVIENSAKRFEEKYKDKSYADGKVGVKVDVAAQNVNINEALLSDGYHVIYTSDEFNNVKMAASNGWIMNIDEIIRKKIDGENKSILDKIPEGSRWNYCLENVEDSKYDDNCAYYGLPSEEFYGGLSYDKDWFDEEGFYIADTAKSSNEGVVSSYSNILGETYYFTGNSSCKSLGPDGKQNTEDDGLPSSLYELIALCEYLKDKKSITPFLLADVMNGQYINYFADALSASLLGAENAQARNSFTSSGTDVVVGYTSEDIFPGYSGVKKPITQRISIDESCGYYTTFTVEKYYTYVFFQLMEEKQWYKDVTDGGQRSHIRAQSDFVYGKQQAEKRGAFLIECSYWYNESNKEDIFSKYESSYGDRELRWMSLPVNIKASVDGTDTTDNSLGFEESKKGENPTFNVSTTGYVCVNNNVKDDKEMIDALTDWFTFYYSDADLSKQAVESGYGMMLDYKVNSADYENATNYIKSFYNLKNNAYVVKQYSNNSVLKSSKNILQSFQSTLRSPFFGTGDKNSVTIRLSVKNMGIYGAFEKKIIDKDAWNTGYYGIGQGSVVASARQYPEGHSLAGQDIVYNKA